MPSHLIAVAFSSLILLRGAAAGAQSTEPIPGLDAYVQAGMKAWKLPGLSIAIVRNDTILIARGYGVRELGKPARVDENTLFAIGSLTKAFTGIVAAMAVDEGRANWDEPLAAMLPGLHFAEPEMDRELTLRDAMSHRTGLARADALWYLRPSWPRDSLVQRMRLLKRQLPFRSGFLYNNFMFMLAGQAVASREGEPWDQLVRHRIFMPLGMTRSTTSVALLASDPDVATPHTRVGDSVVPIRYAVIDNIGPAGSINSSAFDMAQWLRFQLDSGRVMGRRLVSAESFQVTHQPTTTIPLDSTFRARNPDSHLLAYALGWGVRDYHNLERLGHTGGIDGMLSFLGIVPQARLGVVVLSNYDDQGFYEALGRWVLARALGFAEPDPSPIGLADAAKSRREDDSTTAELTASRVAGTRPSLALPKYVGRYVDPLYGEATVALTGADALELKVGDGYFARLDHWHFDTFRATTTRPGGTPTLWTFTLGPTGGVVELKGEFFRGMLEIERPVYRRIE